MKTLVFSAALLLFLGGIARAEQLADEDYTDSEFTDSLELNSDEDFTTLAPPWDRGNPGDRGGRDHRNPPGRGGPGRGDRGGPGDRGDRRHPPYNPRNDSWTCTAKDRGHEEHFGGHSGYGRSQRDAANNAIYVCRLSHGECYISGCDSY